MASYRHCSQFSHSARSIAVVLLLLIVPQLQAQQPFPPDAPPQAKDPAAEDPRRRETLKLIYDCEEALVAGRELAAAELFDAAWALAVQREDPLLTLSSDAEDQLKPGEHRVQAGARVRLQQIFEDASSEFQKLYQESVRTSSEYAQAEAVRSGRVQELERFTVRYQFTPLAQAALRRLIHLRLSRGEFLQAALQYGRLLRLQNDEQPENRIRLARFWLKAQLPEEAIDYLRDAISDSDVRDIELDGSTVALPEATATSDQLIDWLVSLDHGGEGTLAMADTQPWLQPRGNYRRTKRQTTAPALLVSNWTQPTGKSVLHAEIAEIISPLMARFSARSAAELQMRRATTTAAQPLAIDNLVVYRTPVAIMAVDRQSGDLQWETGNAEIQLRQAQAMQLSSPRENETRTFVREQMSDDLFHHLIRSHSSGQLTTDGRFLYAVEDSSAETMADIDRSGPTPGPPFNFLRAYDLQSGSLRGQAGGETGLGGRVNPMAGMFFLGAPLVMGERIYVTAENDQGIFLIQLRARPMFENSRLGEVDLSPERSQLLTIPRTPLRQHPARRFAGLIPSYSRGLLVCGTCDERVVAVSAEDHSVQWIYRYPTNVSISEGRGGIFTFGSVPHNEMSRRLDLENRWLDDLPKISDGRVFLTPRDSDRLICLDLKTGKELWTRVRGTLREIVAVDNRSVIVAGAESLQALDVTDGTRIWQTELDTFVSGRCAATKRLIHVPTVDNSIITIDLTTGRLLATQSSAPHRPGNLLSLDGELLSQNIAEVVGFSTPPDATNSGLARANRAFFEGRAADAETALSEALSDEALGTEARNSARKQLVRLLLDKLREDFSGHQSSIAQIRKLLDEADTTDQQLQQFLFGTIGLTPVQMIEFADRWRQLDTFAPLREELERLEANGTLRNRNSSAQQTAEVIIRFLQNADTGPLSDNVGPTLTQSSLVQAATEVRKAFSERTESEQQQFLASLVSETQKAITNPEGDSAGLLRALLFCELSEVVRDVLDDTSEPLLETEPAIVRERLLMAAVGRGTETAGDSVSKLINLWNQQDRKDLIAELSIRSRNFDPDQTMANVASSASLGKHLRVSSALLPDAIDEVSIQQDRPWQGKPQVTPSAAHSAQQTFPGRVRANSPLWNLPMLGDPGAFAGWAFFQQPGSPLIVAYDRYGRRRWTVNAGRVRDNGIRLLSTSYAVAWGNVLVLKVFNSVRAFDALEMTSTGSPRELWRMDFGPSDTPVSPMWQSTQQYDVQHSGLHPVGPASQFGVPIIANGGVTMFDLLSGEPLWAVSGLRNDTTMTADDQYLSLVSPSTGEVQIRRLSNGEQTHHHSIPPWWISATENTPSSIRDFELEADEDIRWRICVVQNQCITLKRNIDGSALESFDLVTNELRWSLPLPLDSVVSNPNDGHIAVLSDGNRLQIYDVLTGVRRAETTVTDAPDSRFLYLRSSRDRWIVLTNVADHEWEWVPINDSVQVNGFAWAVSQASGKLIWETPIERESLRILSPQRGQPPTPEIAPLLLLMKRPLGPRRENGLIGLARYQARAIDIETGEVIFNDDDLGLNLSFHGIDLKPEDDTIEFSFNKRNVLFDYSSEQSEE